MERCRERENEEAVWGLREARVGESGKERNL